MAIGGDVIPLKLTRNIWLIDLKLDQQAFGHFIHKDPETNMSPIEMIFQHRCATAMLILLYGEFGKTNVIAHGFYELFLLSMRADYAVLDGHLWDMYPYDEEVFTQKKLHEVIPRFVKFYKDILRAKDKTGTSLIALFDTFKTSILADYHTLAEFFKLNVRLALVMVKMESLKFDYEFFELVFSMPGYPVFSSSESQEIFQTLWGEFAFKTDEEAEIIFKLLPLFRLNLNFINDEDIDPITLNSILRLNPKISFRILKFLGISHKFYSGRIAKTLRFHFHKLKERHLQKITEKYKLYYYDWYENAVKRLHDFMKQEFNDQRWLEFMQDLRQDQLNDKN